MQSHPKPQFASWLIKQVETGQYSGLRYVGPNRFRVPWKHNSRKDCNDEDGKIFKAWAVASGKISDFPKDKARWKTNFRCALNNLHERFKLIADNSKNTDDPHKIYEIIIPESLQMQSSQEDYDPDIYSSPTEYFPSGCDLNLLNTFNELDISSNMTEQSNPAAVPNYPGVLAPANNIEIIPEPNIYYEPPPTHPPQVPTINDLEISIFYRKREMLKTIVTCQHLQLHYPQETQEPSVHALCFPSTDGLTDHKQIHYTNRILDSIQRGLTLKVQEDGIYAYRHDRCHVFASTSDQTVAHPNPQKLPLNTMTQLLSFGNYLNELKNFEDNSGRSPEYTIYMCFGEKFPDGKPLDRKLIVVKVVPLACRYFHEQAQLKGASSLHSSNISLQTSYNSLMELINTYIGLPTAEEPDLTPLMTSQSQY
ncbi:interferon regulatory factor 7 isoform X1 [Periophthalmus magnuspinnatus]|uniref:interferon regulatory factor 7 isoform X1 n=1 Tax=Periophthalmus magnuspinnatus TaxID=409849 RepID=UPI00145BE784|nr:interferon regulatory factor 7 isoform X1 [Periophthalmus magnuspinnatus]